jgi:hypothetical protein
MRRLPTFIFGMLIGGLLIYLALNYHLIQAKDGLHLVPKVNATLAGTYVDVRAFTAADLVTHREVVAALVKAGQNDVVDSIAANSLENSVNQWLPPQPK